MVAIRKPTINSNMTATVPMALRIRSPFWASIFGAYVFAMLCGTHWPGTGWPPSLGYQDKFLHFAAYGPLAFLFCLGLKPHPLRSQVFFFTIGGALLLMLGGLDELTQWPVPGRFPDVLDWCADALGILVGMSCFALAAALFNGPIAKSAPTACSKPADSG